MKRTFATKGLMSLVAGFFLFGFLLLAARAEAQTQNWMSPAQAETELTGKINDLYDDVSQGVPGTPVYNDALTHFLYYRVILFKIQEGSSVPDAVDNGLDFFNGNLAGGGNFKAAPPAQELGNITLTKGDLQNLRNDAVDLLTL
jgi:hypothetical protein